MRKREAQALLDAAQAAQRVLGQVLGRINAAWIESDGFADVRFSEVERRNLSGVRIALRSGLERLGERVAINPALDRPEVGR